MNLRFYAVLGVFCVAMLSQASPAMALCLGLRLQNVPSTATFQGASGEYAVYDAAEYMQTVTFQVTSPITLVTCDYFITLSAGGSGNPSQRRMTRGGDTLDYNAYTTAAKTAVIKPLGSAAAGEVITGLFPALIGVNQTQSKSFYWSVNPQQVVRAGALRFQDTSLTVTLYAGLLLGLYQQVDSKTITFQARAESSVDLSLVDSGGAFALADTAQTVDFGALSSGQVRSYDTMVRSNDGYRITLQSQNAQQLRHLVNSAQQIPYSLTIGGVAVDLTSGAAVQALASGAVTPAAGDRLDTKITVGAMSGVEMPGNYRDVITVTVSAQ